MTAPLRYRDRTPRLSFAARKWLLGAHFMRVNATWYFLTNYHGREALWAEHGPAIVAWWRARGRRPRRPCELTEVEWQTALKAARGR